MNKVLLGKEITELEGIIMRNYDQTLKQARETLKEWKERVYEGEDPEELLYEEGLEPDYVFELLF